MTLADLGMIGLAVMGRNLTLNMAGHGFTVAVFDRERGLAAELLASAAGNQRIIGSCSLEDLVGSLTRPRRVMMMIRAEAVDEVIAGLEPLLGADDVIIDGGNSLPEDSARRTRMLADKGILFVGAGISGGEKGARHGPSIMAGGNPAAWPLVEHIFQTIAARAEGESCCGWVGEEGAGHLVKMVHNGIEYGEMQLIAEAYDLLQRMLGLDPEAMQAIFSRWNRGILDSYLLEITSGILGFPDADGEPLLSRILDCSSQKGTGKWMGISALELGIPLTVTGEAVFARYLSARKDERVRASGLLNGPTAAYTGNAGEFVSCLEEALLGSKIICHAQGHLFMRAAAEKNGWRPDYRAIARSWRGGCIIRCRLLDHIAEAFGRDPDLENLLLADFFRQALQKAQAGWRRVVALAVQHGIPVPAFSSALAFYDGFRSSRLPANLLQAQRDYFGAHTYERVDRSRGEFFHTDWSAKGHLRN